MASHFWIGELSGISCSAGLVVVAVAWVALRVHRALVPARIPVEVKLHLRLALGNLLLAGLLGLAIGLDRLLHFWPGYVLDRVFAHAHLAALGFATMMVMGAGYRLLPMLLPAAMPQGRWVWTSALATEAGVLGLAAALLAGARWAVVASALLCALGPAAFLGRVRWMRANPRPAPPFLPRPDLGLGHVALAIASLAVAAGLGLALALAPAAAWKVRAAMLYGALGLVGFLAQMVVGVGSRIVPLHAFLRALARGASAELLAPHTLPSRPVQAAILGLWIGGLPLLAGGLALDGIGAFRAGAALLGVATVLDAAHQAGMLRRAARAGKRLTAP
jgi:hypothetical protein